MKDSIVNTFNEFQISHFDNDMIGLCKAIVDLVKAVRKELGGEELPELDPLENFYKMDPHHPRMELRNSILNGLAYAVKTQDESDEIIKLKNIYVVAIAASYVYHMPTSEIILAAKNDNEFTREDSKNMLLADNMSPNWIKEPSGTDYSAIML